MAGHEIDALLGFALLVTVNVGAAQDPCGHARYRAVVAFQETSHIVAEPAVPLLPSVADEASDLIESCGIPRLCNQLGAGQQRVRFDVPENGRVRQRATLLVARQDRREIESESVHMHLRHPVTQAVLDQAAHDRLVGIERVATAGVVGVSRFVLLEDVIDVVRQTAIAQRRPCPAAFRCVIEHNIQDHFEARAVERLDHVPKFVEDCERALL